MGNLLDRKALLTKEKLQIAKVEFEDGDFVYVRQMYGRERDAFESSMLKKTKDAKGNVTSVETVLDDFRAKLAVMTLCDEEGKALLQPSDYAVLSMSISAKRLEKIVNKAQEINAITEQDKEGILKNSVAGQAGNSSSDSAESSE